MKAILLTSAAAALILATPVMAQTWTRETTTTVTHGLAPLAAPMVVAPAETVVLTPPTSVIVDPTAINAPRVISVAPGTAYDSRTVTQSGDNGSSRSDTQTQRFIGTDGALHSETTTTTQQIR